MLPSAGIWHGSPDLDRANEMSAGCAIGRLGIEFTELGSNYLIGRMPVDSRTRERRLLYGGASVLLAETLVSCAATFVAGPAKGCVGMENNANHLRPVTSGWDTGTARPISWAAAARSGGPDRRRQRQARASSRCTIAVIDNP